MCARNDDDVSPIVQMSLGSRCNDKLTASYYSCPTFCDFNILAAGGSNTSNYCSAYLPCSLSGLTAAESATCCTETLQDDLQGSIPLAVFAMQIVTMLILLLWEAGAYFAVFQGTSDGGRRFFRN
jgi:hypothetical protein